MSAATFVDGPPDEAPEHFGDRSRGAELRVSQHHRRRRKGDADRPVSADGARRRPSAARTSRRRGDTYQELSMLTRRPPVSALRFRRVRRGVPPHRRRRRDAHASRLRLRDSRRPRGQGARARQGRGEHVSGNGSAEQNSCRYSTPADCGPDAFYIEADRIVLCPGGVRHRSGRREARVDVLFTCESTIIVR